MMTMNGQATALISSLTAMAVPPPPATVAPVELTAGDYLVERTVNLELRQFRYLIDEVIPTRSGISILVIDPSRSEMLSGYDAASFRDHKIGSIPHIGPIENVYFLGEDVSERIVLGARELLHQLIPIHGGKVSSSADS